MFADLMNFDNLRRNIREFEAIIEINFATDGQAVLGNSSLLISDMAYLLTRRRGERNCII